MGFKMKELKILSFMNLYEFIHFLTLTQGKWTQTKLLFSKGEK